MKKIILISLLGFILLVCFFIADLYISSFLIIKLIKIDYPISYNVFFQAINLLGIKHKFIIMTLIVFVIIMLIPIFLIIKILFYFNKNKSLYGDSLLTNQNEMQKSGLLKIKTSKYPEILIGTLRDGKYKGEYLISSANTPISVIARSRSGKGISFVIPNLLNYKDSVICYDPKSELYKNTAGYRKYELNQKVYVFSPDGLFMSPEDKKNNIAYYDKWNVLENVNRNTLFTATELGSIGTIFFPPDDEIWNTSALNLFIAIGGYLIESELEYKDDIFTPTVIPSIPEILNFFNSPDKLSVIKTITASNKISNYIKSAFNNYISVSDKVRQSIDATFTSGLIIFNNPITAAATSGKSNIDFKKLRREKITVYFVINPNNMSQYAKLVNLFFTQAIHENMDFMPEDDPSLTNQVLVLIDEFATLGKMPIISNSITHISGYNIRLVMVFQDLAQIEDKNLYGEQAKTILSGCDVEISFPPKVVNDEAKRLSEYFGDYTYILQDKSNTFAGTGTSITKSMKQEKRALFLPQEIVELGFKMYKKTDIGIKEIIIKDKVKPIIAEKIIYFDDKFFIKKIKLNTHLFKTQNILPMNKSNDKNLNSVNL